MKIGSTCQNTEKSNIDFNTIATEVFNLLITLIYSTNNKNIIDFISYLTLKKQKR